MGGLIPGERTSAPPRSVLQVSDRHLRRYPIHTRRSGQSVTASDFGSNGPRFESGRGCCVESFFGQGSLLPLSQGAAFTLASISYLAILVKYILAKKKKKNERRRADLQNVTSIFLIFAQGLSYDLSKFSDDFTPAVFSTLKDHN